MQNIFLFAHNSLMKKSILIKLLNIVFVSLIMSVILGGIFSLYANLNLINNNNFCNIMLYSTRTVNINECNAVSASNELSVIGEFSTDYSLSCKERKHNIELAADALDGTFIDSGKDLSFNDIVGARTKERGYKTAKVIINGEYTDGIGGGVCQVSSTLYNAWILSGLDVVQYCAHSLPSSYVDFSRDATVSEYIDLVLRNNSPMEVYISAIASDGKISIKIYGIAHGKTYRVISELIETVKPDKAIFEEIEDDVKTVTYEILREGKVGFKSRAIIEELKEGVVINTRILREDFYKPTPPKILKKIPRQSERVLS